MNWVDLVIIGTLLIFTLEAVRRPLVLELLDLGSFLLAFFISFRYYNLAAKFFETNFQIPHGLALVFGFMAAWFLAETIFYYVSRSFAHLAIQVLMAKIPVVKSKLANSLSIFPALLRGLVFISLFLVLTATFPIQPTIKKAVQDSQIGSVILKNAYTLEEPVKNIFGGVTDDTLTFLTIKPKTDEKIDLGFQTAQYTVDGQSEIEMVKLVNQERQSRGLNTLVFDSGLRELGRGHSEDMFRRGYFSHYSPDPDSIGAEGKTVADRAEENGVDFLVIGENLAYAPNVSLAHKGLMNSEGHRANILSEDFGRIGIGVIDGGVYGKMFTQVFSN